MANIIIPGKNTLGRTRSEQEMNIRKEWGATMNDGQLDKCKFHERQNREATGSKSNFISQAVIDGNE